VLGLASSTSGSSCYTIVHQSNKACHHSLCVLSQSRSTCTLSAHTRLWVPTHSAEKNSLSTFPSQSSYDVRNENFEIRNLAYILIEYFSLHLCSHSTMSVISKKWSCCLCCSLMTVNGV